MSVQEEAGFVAPLSCPVEPRIMTSAASIREQVFDCVAFSDGLTPDEVAHRLALSVLTVRPRCSELVRAGRLVDSGGRRANDSGRMAKVLILARGAPRAAAGAGCGTADVEPVRCAVS
jgi:hypothetical protein